MCVKNDLSQQYLYLENDNKNEGKCVDDVFGWYMTANETTELM